MGPTSTGNPGAPLNPKTNISLELRPCLERQQGILDRLVEAEACNPGLQIYMCDHPDLYTLGRRDSTWQAWAINLLEG